MDTPWIELRNLVQYILLQYHVVIASPFDDTLGDTLRELSSSLDQQRFKKNVGLVVGSSAGIVAGGLGIAGLALIPFTFGASLGLTISGIALGVASAGVNMGFLIDNYLRDKGVREKAKPTVDSFTALRNNLVKLAVSIDAVYAIVSSIGGTGDLNLKIEVKDMIRIDRDEIEKMLNKCKDIHQLTLEASNVVETILNNLGSIVQANPNAKLRPVWEKKIEEALQFGVVGEDEDATLPERFLKRKRRLRQAAERELLGGAIQRLLELDVADIPLAPRNVAMLFFVFFTDHDNFADIANQEEDDWQLRDSASNPEPEGIVTLTNALPILAASSARGHIADGVKSACFAGKTIVKNSARFGRITTDGAELGQTVGTTAVRVSRGIPVAGIILSAFGIALDAASLGLAAYDLHQCRKEIKENFSQGLSEMSQIIMEMNHLFKSDPVVA